MAFLGVYSIKLLDKRTSMHHALVILHIFRICRHIYHHWVMFWQTGLEIRFLPLELLIFAGTHIYWTFAAEGLCSYRRSHGLLVFPRKSEKLQMHIFDIVKFTDLGLMINLIWVGVFGHLKQVEEVAICVVVPGQEAILFASEPPLLKGK